MYQQFQYKRVWFKAGCKLLLLPKHMEVKMIESMTQMKKGEKIAFLPSSQCNLRDSCLPKGRTWTHKKYRASLANQLPKRIVQPDGSSVMGTKLSIMPLFRPSSQALNSFLLNHKAHIHFLVLNLLQSICICKGKGKFIPIPIRP